MRSLASQDVMGFALAQPLEGLPLIVERDDGHTSTSDLRWWLRSPDVQAPPDIAALDLITNGPVLDVGCATGRHLDELRGGGVPAHGIDVCAEAVRLARQAGHSCDVADVWAYPSIGSFATIALFGGNLGIAGCISNLEPFLAKLRGLAKPSGSLVVSSVDWRISSDGHQAHIGRMLAQHRYPGEVTFRLRLGEVTSAWFDWVWVDPDALAVAAAHLGLVVDTTLWWGPKYAARLTGPLSAR